MHKLFCIDDRDKVGRTLVERARQRGWDARLFEKPNEIPRAPAFVFIWPAVDPPLVERDKQTYRSIATLRPELKLVQSFAAMMLHNDKAAQSIRWSPRWMPKTYVLLSAARAHDAMHELKMPFLSKSSIGHDGDGVRVILTEQNALLELQRVFGTKDGLPGKVVQRDYLIWQRFLPGNPFSYRVVRVGDYEMIARRYREEGAANFKTALVEAVNELDGEANDVLWKARNFFDELDTKLCAVDIVFGDSDTYVLGITMNWNLEAMAECTCYGSNEHYQGSDFHELVLDEIANGVFGVCAP